MSEQRAWERVQKLMAILERDRTEVAKAVSTMERAIKSRFWLRDGRGCYAWDDEDYQKEFGQAIDEIDVAMEPLRRIAADWSNCPTDPEEIKAARGRRHA